MSITTTDVQKLLQNIYGYKQFRPLQQEVIEQVMANNDALVVMPTGGGKSICFQIPALAKEGIGLVISPLIALMEDQVMALQQLGIPAYAYNSAKSRAEIQHIIQAMHSGKIKLLYVSPEKLLTNSFLDFVRSFTINLIAVDEAHCVSIWGNDFRPEYTKIKMIRQYLPPTPMMALTATADRTTQADIQKQLGLREPYVALSSFERKNIFLRVQPGIKRKERILTFLEGRRDESGIIYCLSRKQTESLTESLIAAGMRADFYHAGMDNAERSRVQAAFLNDEVQIICATIAFGMGIDKSNIRWVIHYDLPKNIEGYYQEIGRAGRDGMPAEALLFQSYGTVNQLKRFIDESSSTDDFKAIQHEKLERMWRFAQTASCRTNVILNYFNEYRSEPCQHCDNCKYPPKTLDGTKNAQQALSAVIRLKQQANLDQLIDVLRGSAKKEILSKGFDKIKTYGVGRHVSFLDWKNYLYQLLEQGYLEMDHLDGNKVKVTPLAKKVLFENQQVALRAFAEQQAASKAAPEKASTPQEKLFEKLRAWRQRAATQRNVPAYVIFTDKTLHEIVSHKPETLEDLSKIEGVGIRKLEQFGRDILNIIRKKELGKRYEQTGQFLKRGYDIPQIAQELGIQEATVYSHVAYLLEKGEKINISKYLPSTDLKTICQVLPEYEEPIKLSAIFSHFNGQYEYYQIRLAIGYYNAHKR